MRDLSVVIPARNEMFLGQTIQSILEHKKADTEVIAVCDGSWPDPPLHDHPDVTVLHYTNPIGQRAATNAGVRVSEAKYVMKMDAHCAVDDGFDAKLIADCQPDWTMIPMMYNLHAFDWECQGCKKREYQGSYPQPCVDCGSDKFERAIVWTPKWNRLTVSWRFNRDLQFKYWKELGKRPENKHRDIIETMTFVGACMFMERKRYWDLDGMDERHGSWGQFGTEVACKTWLSGGKLVTTKKTWFSHLFRTGNFSRREGESSWPYHITNEQIEAARSYSRDYWFNNRWPKAVHTLDWLIEKFRPVPDWHEK